MELYVVKLFGPVLLECMSGTSRGTEANVLMHEPGTPAPNPPALLELLSRVSRQAGRHLDSALEQFELQSWEFDVLTTLRKAGEPYEMCPGTIGGRLDVSNSAMTNRINRLEQAGLVERHLSPENRRIIIIRLTGTGIELADRALDAHRASAEQALNRLDLDDVAALDSLLHKLSAALADTKN